VIRSCSTCARHLGLGTCADGRETICRGELWQPLRYHATPVDAARYVDHIRHQAGFTVTRREDGGYELRLEGAE